MVDETNVPNVVAQTTETRSKKTEIKTAPSVSAPVLNASEQVETERIKAVTDNIKNVFIGGTRYSILKGKTQEVPVQVAHVFRKSGDAI